MNRCFLFGDLHGDPAKILAMSQEEQLSEDDILIILGDVGANMYLDAGKPWFDRQFKDSLSSLPCHFLLIHGNHERRPQSIPSYHEEQWLGGKCMAEDPWPRLHFAVDGEIYSILGNKCLAIGGAYSRDKAFRLQYGYPWYSDEQPSEETRRNVEKQIMHQKVDVVLSHTCPYRLIPGNKTAASSVFDDMDYSTELWLDRINMLLPNLLSWYCGHWHIDRHIEKMHFLYRSWEELPKR